MSTSTTHAKLSPSAAERWWNCPGSVALVAKCPPQPSSPHAAEGTLAHSLAADLMLNKTTIPLLLGRIGEVVKVEGRDITIDEDMVNGVKAYYEIILEEYKANFKAPSEITIYIEQRVSLKSVHEDLSGTADTVMLKKGAFISVKDLKYGKGVVVEVVKNKQLMIYLLGAIESLADGKEAFDIFEIEIIQPRAYHKDGIARRYAVTKDELKVFKAELKLRAAMATTPGAAFRAGDWCRWCPAKGPMCSESCRKAGEDAQQDFSAVAAIANTPAKELVSPESMTPEQITRALGLADYVTKWFDSVKEYAQAQLVAGKPIPGYKLVRGKSNRVWTDEAAVIAEFEPTMSDKIFAPKALLSPAKLEKIVGKKKIESLTTKPEGKVTMAPESDPRESITSTAEADFASVPALSAEVVKKDTENDNAVGGLW